LYRWFCICVHATSLHPCSHVTAKLSLHQQHVVFNTIGVSWATMLVGISTVVQVTYLNAQADVVDRKIR
jgi:hypothetical protein